MPSMTFRFRHVLFEYFENFIFLGHEINFGEPGMFVYERDEVAFSAGGGGLNRPNDI